MLRLTFAGLAAVAIVGLGAPAQLSAQSSPPECWYCHPIQGPDGHCRRSADGNDDCDDLSGGGCDLGDPGCGQMTLVSPDELTLDGGKVIRGKWLKAGVFAVRSCTGEQRDIIYTAPQLEKRRQMARTIDMTVDDE